MSVVHRVFPTLWKSDVWRVVEVGGGWSYRPERYVYVFIFRVLCYSAKNARKKTKQGSALHPASLRSFMNVGVVWFRVFYAKETWVSLAGGKFL